MSDRDPKFDDSVAVLYRAILDGNADLLVETYVYVRQGLVRLLGARFPRLAPEEVSDAVSDAVTKFIAAVRNEMVRSDTAAAYLTQIAINQAIDYLRDQTREVATGDIASFHQEDRTRQDDEITRLLDARASGEIYKRAIELLVQEGSEAVAHTVATKLDLTASLNREPSDREVADAVGITHPTVGRHLVRFAEKVREVAAGETGERSRPAAAKRPRSDKSSVSKRRLTKGSRKSRQRKRRK